MIIRDRKLPVKTKSNKEQDICSAQLVNFKIFKFVQPVKILPIFFHMFKYDKMHYMCKQPNPGSGV